MQDPRSEMLLYRRRHGFTGFTLIELVVVMAIAAILAILAIGQASRSQPRTRLLATASDLRLKLLETRSLAVRSMQNHKVCLYAGADPNTAPGSGRVVVFRCGTRGEGACNDGRGVCGTSDPYAGSGVQWDTARVACADPAKWCMIEDINYSSGTRANDNVSINLFYDAEGTVTTRKSLELTYVPNGFIDSGRSTLDLSAGSVLLTNFDQMLGTGRTDFQNLVFVNYLAGGGARIRE